MINSFKDDWLEAFFNTKKCHKKIPSDIEKSLTKKLDILNVATKEMDLRSPPGNRFKHLEGTLKDFCAIRVNDKCRLIFKWDDNKGEADGLYFDPHKYK